MEFRFANYLFLQEQMVLYKNDELIPLKRNQAELINYFLCAPERIHSKDDIMDSVWQGKVVSEQVVFQTISQLRGIFGDSAIQTFSKKGYKWQLPLHKNKPHSQNSSNKSGLGSVVHQHHLALLGVILILSSIAVLTTLNSVPDITEETIPFELVISEKATPQQRLFNDIAASALENNSHFSLATMELSSSVRQLFSTPRLLWKKANLANDKWLFWGDSYSSDKGTFLNYGLSRDQVHWQGYVFGSTQSELQTKLSRRIAQLHDMGLFSPSVTSLDVNTLVSMQKTAPEHPDVLILLADQYINLNHLDVGLTYLQKLKRLDTSYAFSAYQAQAQWFIGKVYKMRRQYLQATNSLNKMSEILEKTPLWSLSFRNIETAAWLAYEQTDYDTMLNTVDRGVKLAKKQADPLTLFQLHILYSILAEKASDDHNKYIHLNEAQALLLKHKLDESNQGIIYYHYALFTEDENEAIPYLERILSLHRTGQNYWVQDEAFETLVNHYLQQRDFDSAHALFKDSSESPQKLVLLAKVYLAQEKQDVAIGPLEQAFELATLNYDMNTGVQAALMLYQILDDQPEVRAEYLAYIETNAKPSWLKQHDQLLAAD